MRLGWRDRAELGDHTAELVENLVGEGAIAFGYGDRGNMLGDEVHCMGFC